MGATFAAIKHGHRFVCGPCLHLEEIGLAVCTFRTRGVCRIGELPGRLSSKHVVLSLPRKVGDAALDAGDDGVHVGARAAFEAKARVRLVRVALVRD